MQHSEDRPTLSAVPPPGDIEVAVSAAYEQVAAGYEKALTIPDLPQVEADGLRACLLAALRIARRPRLFLAQSQPEGLPRSPLAD